MMANMIEGFICINKPEGVSSFFCVKKIRSLLPKKTKVGHAGTLDPFASGLLILGIGRQATRMLSYISKLPKEYKATGKLGVLTDTLDREGKVLQQEDVVLTGQDIQEALKSLGKEYLQTPPAFSALKHQGKPLYKFARHEADLDFEAVLKTKRRMVEILEIELLNFDFPHFTLRALVSHGTYIRSLINDIAGRCNTLATTYALERLSIGPFNVAQAKSFNEMQNLEIIEVNLLSIESLTHMLKDYKEYL